MVSMPWLTFHCIIFLPRLRVKLYETRNRTQSSDLNYSMITWYCQECQNGTKLQTVRDDRNCSSGYFPVYISRGCCWVYQPCYPGFAKSEEGQHGCSKCPTDSIPNKNQTKCLKVGFQYFIISDFQQLTAFSLLSLGIVYTLSFLAVFLFDKNTPIVKSSNLMLSVCQIIFHLIMNTHFSLTALEQKKWIYFKHSITGGYLLRFIISIYIVKTNQLLTIKRTVRSRVKIKRTVSITLSEAYNTSTIFINVIYLVFYSKYEHGIYQENDSLTKYYYCNMTSYFYADTSSLIILSIICSVQLFLARKLPANFNETYYIFLGMFTTTILLVLSIPQNGSFDHDGQKIFVNSILIYCSNMALISIAYGYKIHILVFQKDRKRRKLSRRSCSKLCKKTWRRQ